MKKQFILDLPDGEISAANAAALSGKLSQMANGAIYDDAGNTVPIHEQQAGRSGGHHRVGKQ